MLKGIPSILPPELLKIMMEMGHGDTLVIGDGNFPAAACAKRLVRCDGHGVVPVLEAVLQLFPLDTPDSKPACVMQVQDPTAPRPTIWRAFQSAIAVHEPSKETLFEIERFAFYEEAKKAYAVVATGETAIYANLILKKGVIA
ncbi:MAG: fucose isomerase [Oscillospiraceae bacterium]|nr:fucose isomerase [Oscillospiraceae bacterium]